MRMPAVVDPDRFPTAERCALRLDGDCFDLGLTVVSVDALVGPAVRAGTLSRAVAHHGLVVDTWAAAWVHGAWSVLPNPLTLAVDLREGRRTRTVVPPPREAVYVDGDVQELDGVRVTSPLKTAFDLLRLHERTDPRVEGVARELLKTSGLRPDEAVSTMAAAPRCNGKLDVLARIRALCPSDPPLALRSGADAAPRSDARARERDTGSAASAGQPAETR